MSLLESLLFEIEKSGGIAKMYEMASQELISDKKDINVDDDYWARQKTYKPRQIQRIVNTKTGKVYKNATHAAIANNIRPRYFQQSIKDNGTYLDFIKVA